MTEVLSHTESVCPICLERIPARRVIDEDNIYLEKNCKLHGSFRTIIWRGQPSLSSWMRIKSAVNPKLALHPVDRGCPYDCGLCPDHRQQSCCVLLELTQRCDLGCPVCFADAGNSSEGDLSLTQIEDWYRRLIAVGGPYNIQLSGGEPAVRDDLPEIIRLGKSLGFSYFQLNSNGIRLSRDFTYLQQLKEAGLSSIFLQFDGCRDDIYRQIRGHALLQQKVALIDNCARLDIGIVLVPTLIPDINCDEIGKIILFALEHMPVVRGVHFQPISYFGRYPQAPVNSSRITIPEVMRAIEAQTEGLIQVTQFSPPVAENSACSFQGNFVQMRDGTLKAISSTSAVANCCQTLDGLAGITRSRQFVAQYWSAPKPQTALQVISNESFGGWDEFIERRRTHTFCVSGMAFQDAWTLDLERLRDCKVHIASPNGKLVPFCAYNLTSQSGQALYRCLVV